MKFPLNLKMKLLFGHLNPIEMINERTGAFALAEHPGSFGYLRANHRHEGVDLYCPQDSEVQAMEEGIVVWKGPFTGELAGSPWWNNTEAVMIASKTRTILYGEIKPLPLQIGQLIKEGQVLGQVTPVLKKDKGWPQSMLHLEVYEKGTREPIKEWPVSHTKKQRPKTLLDPTSLLVNAALENNLFI